MLTLIVYYHYMNISALVSNIRILTSSPGKPFTAGSPSFPGSPGPPLIPSLPGIPCAPGLPCIIYI